MTIDNSPISDAMLHWIEEQQWEEWERQQTMLEYEYIIEEETVEELSTTP
tara:strand:+ start:276 stop:425 length:150 start_codon:yes stop_codon:yes gene_type:complete